MAVPSDAVAAKHVDQKFAIIDPGQALPYTIHVHTTQTMGYEHNYV